LKRTEIAQATVVWFRRDLRLHDNPALRAAARAGRVVPLFVWSPDEEAPWAPGAASRWWLHHSLAALGASLGRLGAPLVVRRGPSLDVLRAVAREAGAAAVCWNRLYEPAARARDAAVEQALRADGLAVETFNAALLAEPHEVATGAGDPYRVFTPFWRTVAPRLGAQPPEPAPPRLAGAPFPGEPLDGLGLLPRIAWDGGLAQAWRPGEAGALAALDDFCESALSAYAAGRDRPGEPGTSRLSPHLHFGEIGPRQVVARILGQQARGRGAGTETFLKELGWREFAHHLLWHFPRTPAEPLDERFRRLPWRTDYAADLRRWQRGATGFPIVDAGLRELWATGWMHNRVRMIAASLLAKNLLIPWQEGARWFWDTLVDADLANNTLGWQWTAGCGADAAPFFRIFNPVLQSKKFDPQGRYLRRWLPELQGVPDEQLHEPRPEAIVDLAATRVRALEAFSKIKANIKN
jgi:deoxyribodipyrimidine photo-lyase